MARNQQHMTLGVISFGLAVGITAALVVFLLGVTASVLGWGVAAAQVLASVFIGFGPTLVGSIAGAVWAFFDGFVIGALVAWLYNRFLLNRQRHGS